MIFITKLHLLIKLKEFFIRSNYIYLKVVNEKLYRSEAMTITLQQYRLLNTVKLSVQGSATCTDKKELGIFVLGIFFAATYIRGYIFKL